jgi:hypothetical protein
VSTRLAHVAGVPLEEGLIMLVPAACAFAVAVRARLGELVAWLRRR